MDIYCKRLDAEAPTEESEDNSSVFDDEDD